MSRRRRLCIAAFDEAFDMHGRGVAANNPLSGQASANEGGDRKTRLSVVVRARIGCVRLRLTGTDSAHAERRQMRNARGRNPEETGILGEVADAARNTVLPRPPACCTNLSRTAANDAN